MNLTFERDALLQALGTVDKLVERKATIPILSNVLLDPGPLQITGTDLDIMGTVTVEGQAGAASTPITVAAHTLFDIVRKLPAGGQIEITQPAPGEPLAIRCGRSRFALPTLPAEDFPDLASGELPHTFTIEGKILAAMIERVEFAISTEETRHYLNGIYWHVAGDKLRMVATDGHRLARVDTAAPDGAAGMPGIIVPRKAVSEIKRLAASAGVIEVALSEAKIQVRAKATVLTSKLIDGTFPDYERVIPSGNDQTLALERAPLASAIDRVMTVCTDSRAVKLAAGPDGLALTVRNAETGASGSEEIEAAYEGPPIEIGFNGRYMADILDAAGGDTVVCKVGPPGAPLLFHPVDDEDALFVLMPMRVA